MNFDNGNLHRETVAEKDAEQASLGISAKYVRGTVEKKTPNSLEKKAKKAKRQLLRNRTFAHQKLMVRLLPLKTRLAACKSNIIYTASGVDLVATTHTDDPERRAHFKGLQTCGSVWLCPCCSKRISEVRRRELNQLIAWARAKDYQISLITLTFSHKKSDRLKTKLDQMKDAQRRLKRHWTWDKKLKPSIIGHVTASEVTGGGPHGWHPHSHIIIITKPGTDLRPLRKAWLASLKGAALTGGKAAFDLQDGQAAGSYITKWGPAEELTLHTCKKGKTDGGRTIWQLQADACDHGDKEAERLIVEYADAYEGRRQLVWSNGLKDLAGIGEITDAEAANSEPERVEIDKANIRTTLWKSRAVGDTDRRAQLLDDCENHSAAAAVRRLKLDDHPDVYSPIDNNDKF